MKIVLYGQPDAQRLQKLDHDYPQARFVVAANEDELRRELTDADACNALLSDELLRLGKNLLWVQAMSAGVEFLQRAPELVASDVVVTNARGAHAATIAEHTFAMLLAFTRGLRYFDRLKERREWARSDGYSAVSGIAGLTMAVLGFGNIGKAIARRALGFEMRVIGIDAHEVPPLEGVSALWRLDRLHDALREADVVAVATPITPRTRGMIGATELGLLRPGAYLLVVSRGGIVDEPALIDALRTGRLAGAGLDVASTEPLPDDDPLWDVENLIITPHVSGGSRLTIDLAWSIFHDNVGRFVRGEPLNNVVDKRLGY